MKEIEAKILEINRKKVEETLTGQGAKKIFDGDIQTFFFDFKDGAIVKAKNVLRLRQEQGKNELTFKKVKFSKAAKQAEELTIEVSDLETAEKILENLGLQVQETMKKHRTSYKIDDVGFDIDCYLGSYDYIPEFMEIEAEKTSELSKYAKLLGYKPEDCLPWSTNDLIRHYSKGNKKLL